VTIGGRERLTVPGPAGDLEAIAHEPEGSAQPLYAIVCHPHPLYGGTMDNKVVYTVARALQTSGIATLRFNFRGVGASRGTYDEGAGETRDAAALADFGAARWPHRRLVLAGFSFGAFVALRLALDRSCNAVRRENHRGTVGHFLELLDEHRTAFAQPLDHVTVVHHLVAHVDRSAEQLQRALDDLDRAINAGAEAAGIG